MAMERIERALEVARLQRLRHADAAAPVAAPSPSFADVASADTVGLRLEDATLVDLPARDVLRERYVSFPDEPGPAALAYQMLRTQVLRRAREHNMRCIGVASAASGEGKSITAINLALSMALDPNQSIVLADLDLRRPSLASTLELEPRQGLEAWFERGEPLAPMCQRIAGFERLAVLPTLRAVQGSSEMLASPVTQELMTRLRAIPGAPLVLVDLPPVLLSDDVLAIAPLLDGIVLVVTEERTRREDLQRVFDLLRTIPVIGTVLNASAEAERRAY